MNTGSSAKTEGTGTVSGRDHDDDDNFIEFVEATCPVCDGSGCIEGDADDVG